MHTHAHTHTHTIIYTNLHKHTYTNLTTGLVQGSFHGMEGLYLIGVVLSSASELSGQLLDVQQLSPAASTRPSSTC